MRLSGPFRLCAPKAWQLVLPPVQKVPRDGSGPHCAWTALAVVLYCPALTSLVPEALATQKDPVKPPRKLGESSATPVRDRRWEELSRWTAHLLPTCSGSTSLLQRCPTSMAMFSDSCGQLGTVPSGAGSPLHGLVSLFPLFLPW